MIDKAKQAYQRGKDFQQRMLANISPVSFLILLFITLATIVLLFLDMQFHWNGYPIDVLLNRNVWVIILKIFFAIATPILVFHIGKNIIGLGWQLAMYMVWSVAFVLSIGTGMQNVLSLFHLLLPILFYYVIGSSLDPEEKQSVIKVVIILTLFDFFGYALLKNTVLSQISAVQFNRVMVPLWLYYILIFAIKHADSGKSVFQLAIIFLILFHISTFFYGTTLIAAQTDQLDQKVIDDFKSNLKNFPSFFKIFTPAYWNQLFNMSYAMGRQEETPNPQGIFIEPLEPGHIFTEGMPVYAWALLEARTLDDPITAIISCKTERETEFGEQEIMGIADPNKLTVIKGAERSISCEFPPLPEDNYEIIFNAEFDFSADARRKIYLMDRERMLNDFRVLRQKGLEPSREGILRELYDITDTDPELIYTSGPISIGMKTDNVPWDVGRASQSTLKPLFGVTITNYWPKGGRIKRINNLYFKIPDEMTFRDDLCDPNTPMISTSEESEPGFKVYKLDTGTLIATRGEEILIDVDEFRTFNCRIEVDEDSLDNVPVTTRFLKVHVDYDYVLEEELDIYVEGLGLGEDAEDILGRNQICCQYRFRDLVTHEDKVSSYGLTDTLEECYTRDSFAYGVDVDMKYCEQLCCEVSSPDSDVKSYYWVESSEECDKNDIMETHSLGNLVDKYNCDVE